MTPMMVSFLIRDDVVKSEKHLMFQSSLSCDIKKRHQVTRNMTLLIATAGYVKR